MDQARPHAGTSIHPVLTPYTLTLDAAWQALANICAQPDAPPLPPEALQRAAAWLLAALDAHCGGCAAPAASASAARQFCALLRALAAVLAEVRLRARRRGVSA